MQLSELKPSISELSRDQALAIHQAIRSSRTQLKATAPSVRKSVAKMKAKSKSMKNDLTTKLATITPEQAKALLEILEAK